MVLKKNTASNTTAVYTIALVISRSPTFTGGTLSSLLRVRAHTRMIGTRLLVILYACRYISCSFSQSRDCTERISGSAPFGTGRSRPERIHILGDLASGSD